MGFIVSTEAKLAALSVNLAGQETGSGRRGILAPRSRQVMTIDLAKSFDLVLKTLSAMISIPSVI